MKQRRLDWSIILCFLTNSWNFPPTPFTVNYNPGKSLPVLSPRVNLFVELFQKENLQRKLTRNSCGYASTWCSSSQMITTISTLLKIFKKATVARNQLLIRGWHKKILPKIECEDLRKHRKGRASNNINERTI